MKSNSIILILIASVAQLVGSAALFAQKIEYPLFVRNLTPVGNKEFRFIVSAHPNGSDSIDQNLDEREIPSLPLPGDQFYVWTIAPTEEVIWLSPKEVRKLKIGEKHLEIYDLRANWNGGTLEIVWSTPIPEYIDSIVVVDGVSDYPNNILYARVGIGTKISTDNPAFDRFNVMVWYNTTTLDVEDNITAPLIRLWPSPATDRVTVESELLEGSTLMICDTQGNIVHTSTHSGLQTTIDCTQLSSGFYTLRLVHPNGTVSSSMFVHY